MNKRILTLGTATMLLAVLLPASAYHIQGNYVPDGVGTGPGSLTSGDWVLDNSALIACESDGPNDPRNAAPVNLTGLGGLCTTGRNAVSGEDAPATMPGRDNWTRLDVCTATTAQRLNDGDNGFQQNPCEGDGTSGGSTGTIAWFAEIGAYSCFVPTTGTVLDAALSALSDKDYALYYEELYAWWSYDIDGTEPGYHGHVSAFPDPSERQVDPNNPTTQVLRGSAEVTAVAGPPSPVDDISSTGGDFPNNCGSSPSNTADGNQGPVMVAANPDSSLPPPAVPALGLPAVVVLSDDGMGGASLFLRVNPSWSCDPVAQSGTEYSVECRSAGSLDNVCILVDVAVVGATGRAACEGGPTLDTGFVAPDPVLGVGAGVDGPSLSLSGPSAVTGPFRCTADVAAATPGWIVACSVNP